MRALMLELDHALHIGEIAHARFRSRRGAIELNAKASSVESSPQRPFLRPR